MNDYTEDNLVQQTMANYLRDELGWCSVTAFNEETFGPNGLLGRNNEKEVILKPLLRQKLAELNKDLPEAAYQDAVRQITELFVGQTMLATNREKYDLFLKGVQVAYRTDSGEQKKSTLRVFAHSEV